MTYRWLRSPIADGTNDLKCLLGPAHFWEEAKLRVQWVSDVRQNTEKYKSLHHEI